jgi:hypothetical protein
MAEFTVSNQAGQQAVRRTASFGGNGATASGDARRMSPPILALGMPFLLGSYIAVVQEAVIPALLSFGVATVLVLLGRGEATGGSGSGSSEYGVQATQAGVRLATASTPEPRCRARRRAVRVSGVSHHRPVTCTRRSPAAAAKAAPVATRRFTLVPEQLTSVRDIGNWLSAGPAYGELRDAA